jgi:hypothetical protein
VEQYRYGKMMEFSLIAEWVLIVDLFPLFLLVLAE